MKSIVLGLVVGVAMLITPYLIASFTLWDMNPRNWSVGERWAVSAIGLVASVFGGAWIYDITKSDE